MPPVRKALIVRAANGPTVSGPSSPLSWTRSRPTRSTVSAISAAGALTNTPTSGTRPATASAISRARSTLT